MTSTREDSPVGGQRGIDLAVLDEELQLCCWKDADLARATGLSKRTLANMRRNPGQVTPRTISLIALALRRKQQEDPELAEKVGRLLGRGNGS